MTAPSAKRAPPDAMSAVWPAAIASGALVAQHVAGKATRDTLFLTHFGLGLLPAAMIAAAVLSSIALVGISRALGKYGPARMVPTLFASSAVLFLIEWRLSLHSERVAAVAVYGHTAVFGSAAVSAFWSLVNERFDPHAAKKVVGRIASGGTVGGVVGGVVVWRASAHLSVPMMLALLAGINGVGLWGTLRVGSGPRGPEPATEPLAGGGWRIVRETAYLRDLALLVFAGAIIQALLDWLLSAHASHAYGKGSELLGFFALFNVVVGVLSFLAQTLLSRPLLERRGLAGTVQLQPVAIALGAVLALVSPQLAMVVLLRGGEAVTRNSLYRSAYELFYTPLPTAKKRATKTLIDVGVDRVGTMLASVGLLAIVHLGLDGATRIVLIAAMALAGLAWLVSARLHDGYVSALAASLKSGAIALGSEDAHDLTTRNTLAETTAFLDRQTLLAGIEQLQRTKEETAASDLAAEVAVAIPLLANDALVRDTIRTLRKVVHTATGQLLDALLDQSTDVRVRRRLPRVLKVCRTEQVTAGFLVALRDPVFDVRVQVALALMRMQSDGNVVLAADRVFDAAVHELALDPAANEADRLRRLAHVFTMLGLVLERAPLLNAHRAMRSEDPRLRGTAHEYLEVTLPPRVREVLLPLLAHAKTGV